MSAEHAEIWLQPWCDGCEQHSGCEGRQWCQDDAWGKCDECDQRSVRYVLAPQPPASRSREGIDERAERIVTELFKDFRDWSRRGFGPEDVTWCEVKDRVMRLCSMAPLPSRDSAVEAGLAVWPSSESYDERIAVKEILDAAAPHLHAEWLERFLQDDSGLPSRFTDGEAK